MAKAKQHQKTVILSTKVSPDDADKFNLAAVNIGLKSGYELVQLIVDCLLRYIDSPSSASSDLKRMMQVFDDFSYATGRVRGVSNDANKSHYIDSAIYFVHKQGKKSDYVVEVSKPFFGDPQASYNVQEMFEHFIYHAFPKQHHQLQGVMRDIGTDSLMDAFFYVLDNADTKSADDVTFHELFADNVRDITGKEMNIYDKKYKTKQHADIDGSRFNIHQTNQHKQMAQSPQLPFEDSSIL